MKVIKTNSGPRLKEILETLKINHSAWVAQSYSLARINNKNTAKVLEGLLLGLAIHHLASITGYVIVFENSTTIIVGQNMSMRTLDQLQQDFIKYIPADVEERSAINQLYDFSAPAQWNAFVGYCEILTSAAVQTIKPMQVKQATPVAGATAFTDEGYRRLLGKGLAEREARTKPFILLVDDDPVSLLLAKKALEKDFIIETAATAAEARLAYMTHAPDVVFLDIGLPDGNGHEVLRDMIAADRDAYVVMLSGNSFQGEIMKAIQKGAKGFVSKPFARVKLLQYIAQSPHCVDSKINPSTLM